MFEFLYKWCLKVWIDYWIILLKYHIVTIYFNFALSKDLKRILGKFLFLQIKSLILWGFEYLIRLFHTCSHRILKLYLPFLGILSKREVRYFINQLTYIKKKYSSFLRTTKQICWNVPSIKYPYSFGYVFVNMWISTQDRRGNMSFLLLC